MSTFLSICINIVELDEIYFSKTIRFSQHKLRFKQNSRDTHFCDNFFDIFSLKFRETKKSINHIFMICIHIENQNQKNFYFFVLLKIFVFHEFFLKHLRYNLTNVSFQSNFSFNNIFNSNRLAKNFNVKN